MPILALLNSDNFNMFAFGAAVKDEEEAIEAAYDLGLIPAVPPNCHLCLFPMHEERKPTHKLGFRWRCNRRTCRAVRPTISPLRNTFFDEIKLPILKALRLMVCWFFGIKVSKASVHCEVDGRTAVDFYSFCREVCRVVSAHDQEQVGGPGDIVEIDESHLFTRKNHRGRMLRRAIWVFGGISRLTKKRFAVQVRRRDRATLWPIMQKHIAQGSFVFSDEWAAYAGCAVLGFSRHLSVNHSLMFAKRVRIQGHFPLLGHFNPITGRTTVNINTNTKERAWGELKRCLRRCRSVPMVQNYIGEYLYRQNILSDIRNIRRNQGLRFLRFVRDVARVYPGYSANPIVADIAQCECPDC